MEALWFRQLDPSSLRGLDDTDSEDQLLARREAGLEARMEARREQEQKERGEGCGLRGEGWAGKILDAM